jgi:hypothetical protein
MHLRCLTPGEVAAVPVLSDDLGFQCPGEIEMDSTITRMTSGCSILPVKRQEFTSRTVIPLVPFTGFAKSLWKVVNSLATVKLVGSDGSL